VNAGLLVAGTGDTLTPSATWELAPEVKVALLRDSVTAAASTG
jgi:hypothetical protein